MVGRRAFITTALAAAAGSAGAGRAATRPPHTAESPDDVVRRLYKDFAWESVFACEDNDGGKWTGLLEQPLKNLDRYFAPKLAELLVQDRRQARRAGEIGRIDFLPMWAGQDPCGATDLLVSRAVGGLVEVAFTYPGRGGNDRHVKLQYSLTKTASGWRITDISEPSEGWSVMALLTAK